MRPEKKYLIREVNQHLDKSDYGFVTDFSRVNVEETAHLRAALAKSGAEFHVVKNTLLRVAMQERNMPDLSAVLEGPTALVTGGKEVSEVAKTLIQFAKTKDKGSVKGGFMSGRLMSASEVEVLSKLPSLDVMRAQLLALFNAPAQQCAAVLNAVPAGFLNVLQARVREQEAVA